MSAYSRRRMMLGAGLTGLFGLCGMPVRAGDDRSRPAQAPEIGFATWSDDEPYYLFYPGDAVEVQVPSAPELSRQTTVGPDGRIVLPLIGPVMAAYKSVPDLQVEIATAYAAVLRTPQVFVMPGALGPLRVMVGGEVRNPGWVEIQGELDALQAVMAAGGLLPSARSHKVVIIRRSREGAAMQRVVDVQDVLKGRDSRLHALRRFDIVFVPRTTVAEVGVFIDQNINNLIPGAVGNYFTYKVFN